MRIRSMLVKGGFVWLLGLLAPVVGFAQFSSPGSGGQGDDNSAAGGASLVTITMGECENRFANSPAASSCPSGGATSADYQNGVWHCALQYYCNASDGSTMSVTFDGSIDQISSLYFCDSSTFSTSSC